MRRSNLWYTYIMDTIFFFAKFAVITYGLILLYRILPIEIYNGLFKKKCVQYSHWQNSTRVVKGGQAIRAAWTYLLLLFLISIAFLDLFLELFAMFK
jgi:hypothetical protein